ncbi:MAG: hypothetical protein O2788_04430 [Chloroflexi bacterium]|nr:hypothetical protein [Chloroflexota bacterium]
MNPATGSAQRFFTRGKAIRLLITPFVAALLLMAFSATQQLALAQGIPTVISGRVVQGTPGSEIPAGVSVVLLVVDDARQEIVATESKLVGTNGEFEFTDFLAGPGFTYRVAADDGSEYTPSIDLSAADSTFDNVELTIYDRTESLDDISVSTYSLLIPSIDRIGRRVGMLGVVQISNRGDHVWIPDTDNPALTGFDLFRFNLPEGFSDLSVESNLPSGNILEIGTGFALTNPIPPGDFDILMTFIAPYEGNTLTFPLRLPYGADLVRIMLPEGQGSVTGLGFGPSEGALIDSTAYSVVTGQSYARDSQLDVTFSDLPTPSLVERIQSFLEGRGYIVVIAWVAGAAMLGLLAYAFFFARKRSQADDEGDDYPEYDDMERTEIVEAIAELDAQHDAGEIEVSDYTARRAFLTRAALSMPESPDSEVQAP